VAKKRRARGRASAPFALIVIGLIAAAAAWWTLAPRHHHSQRDGTVAVVTSTPTETEAPDESATDTPEPVATATERSEPSAEPSSGEPTEPSAAPSATPAENVTAPPRATIPRVHGSGAKLALIVDDCGQWIDTERGFVALGVPLTVSVLPDVPYTSTIAKEAAAAGKGVMLHLPMETVSGLNPGPGKVTTEMSDAQIEAQVESDLAQVPLAAGVNNHEGSKGSADPRVMRDVIDVLAKHGDLFFIDSKTSATSVGEQTAQAHDVPTAARDVFLDNQESVAYSEAQLREAAAIALKTGSAIAIGHPRPTTLEAVRLLIPQLQAEGVQFVLARQLVVPQT
jgi:polysaccharide deacetylase 2 family uncharacterized protein YibQ